MCFEIKCYWAIFYLFQICWVFTSGLPQHPTLYFDATDVPILRHKAKTSHVKIAKIIQEAGRSLKENPDRYLPPKNFKSFGSKWNEIYGNNLCAFAMYCVLYPDDTKALTLVKLFMDRLTSYPDWYVTDSPQDQVPVGHTLTGYATTIDFLYESFTDKDRKLYLAKLKNVTEHMNEWVKQVKGGWTQQHIHNHAPSNVLATLIGAMICKVHFPKEALPWEKAAIELLEKAMLLFSFIVDGSCDEGVAYGSYTSRGITQYVYLALRHFGKDHTKNPWLKEHFWFFFTTTMPGYQRSVGIADSNHNWFYGPESQLVFLDAFVMKNGYGNWLADKIRSKRSMDPPFAASTSHMWSTAHTEFIFYDASIKAVKPKLPSNSSLHIFSDWGVVTHGGGQDYKDGNTFLSFKSGALNGEAVADIVDHKLLSSFIKGWSNFNAGHEHPDQNSFVFAPNGRYFITEALYSVKFTYLNNALTFAPMNSKCNQPWEGQAGECTKWLAYNKISPVPRGRIVTASASSDGFVYMAGDAVNAYRSELGLQSVQRSLLLLHPEVLLVLDTVTLVADSKLQRASAYFHNILHNFHPFYHDDFQGAKVVHSDGPYSFFWFQPDKKSPKAQYQSETLSTEAKPRTTNFVNITFNLNHTQPTRIAYVFMGPNVQVANVKFLPKTNAELSCIEIAIDDVDYRVSIVSLTTSVWKRMKLLGFGGYASVHTNNKISRLGMNEVSNVLSPWSVNNDATMQAFLRGLVSSTNLSSATNREANFSSIEMAQSDIHIPSSFLFIFVFHLCIISIAWVFRKHLYRLGFKTIRRIIPLFVVVLMIVYYVFWNFDYSSTGIDISYSKERELRETRDTPTAPTVVIVSLPQSGSELLQNIFENATEFLFLPFKDASIPIGEGTSAVYDPCYWPDSNHFTTTKGWFKSLSVEPLLFLNNHPSNPSIEKIRRKFRKNGKTGCFVLDFSSGFWNSKLPWLQNAIGSSMRTIAVVRDPRSWIYSLIRNDLSTEVKTRQGLLVAKLIGDKTCPLPAMLPFEFRKFKGRTTVEKLAEVWNANIATMIRNGRQLQIVRFEDLVADPQHASLSIMRRLRMTIALPELNRITRAVRSTHFALPNEPKDFISSDSVYNWKGKLLRSDADTIEQICQKTMRMLDYL